jgi:RNA polymerase sigma-70 factor, ECF subfamily
MENLNEKTDEELASLLLIDQASFLALMQRYEPKLLGYIFRISKSTKEEAEDILQDVFIKVYKNINSFDSGLKFSSWIYRITHNEVISSFRKKSARPQLADNGLDDALIERIAGEFDVVREIDTKRMREVMLGFIDRLDSKYREVMILKFLEEKDYKEISDILKKPMGTVATLINRAKKKLRIELENNKKLLNDIYEK